MLTFREVSKKSITFVLTMALILSSIMVCFTVVANADVTVKTGTVDGKKYILGDILYQTDFESDALDTLPAGWQASGKSWGWGTGTGSAKIVENGSYGKVLSITASSLDFWVSAPEIKTRNYVYEAKFIHLVLQVVQLVLLTVCMVASTMQMVLLM